MPLVSALYACSVAASADIPFEISPPRAAASSTTPIGGGWRHSYDIVITAQGDARVVHDADGSRHVFAPIARASDRRTQGYESSEAAAGRLEVRGKGHRWSAEDGRHVTFMGSLPTHVERDDGSMETLRYANGRLASVSGDGGASLRFGYREGRLRHVAMPDGTHLSLTLDDDSGTLRTSALDGSGACLPAPESPATGGPGREGVVEDTEGADGDGDGDGDDNTDGETDAVADDTRCDSETDPAPSEFTTGPGIPGALRLDVRPASCRSHFVERYGTERGSAIEVGLAGDPHYAGYLPTVRSFPIADFTGGEIRVVRSRDLGSPSLDVAPDGLFDRLVRDGREIESRLLGPLERDGDITVRDGASTTTLTHRPGRLVVLELVVRRGFASPDQIRQISRARATLLSTQGIVLRVIEIP